MADNFSFLTEAEVLSAITTAISNVSNRVQNDLLVQARRNVQKYYDQYNPDVYIRTYNLRDNVDHIPVLINSSLGNLVLFQVGFEYDSSKIGAYPDGGDPALVFANFLDGVHPNTFAHGVSQNTLMDEYYNRYLKSKIDRYVFSELKAALSSL